VVTEFLFRATELPPIVQLAMQFHPDDRGADLLRLVRDMLPGLSRDIGLALVAVNAPPAPFVPPEHRLRPCWALALVGFGDPSGHAAAVEAASTAVSPLFDLETPIPFTELQSMFDAGAPAGNSCYERAVYLPELTDDAIAVVAEEVPRKSSPLSQVVVYTLDGAYNDVGELDTALGGSRAARYAMFVVGIEPGRAELTAAKAWVRRFTDTLSEATIGHRYVNGMSEYGPADVRATYGADKHERLARIKSTYDPDNVFHHNVNVLPN
jgi:FAD/FMN-containing dehydrogenase